VIEALEEGAEEVDEENDHAWRGEGKQRKEAGHAGLWQLKGTATRKMVPVRRRGN